MLGGPEARMSTTWSWAVAVLLFSAFCDVCVVLKAHEA